jgi:hypothetical protein
MHSNDQSITVRHKEYLGEIRGSTSYAVVQSFDLNPGMSGTFPWLSGVANRFQEYKLKGAVFHYVPSSGAAVSGTNAALGTVMMQTSYRASDTPPLNKVEMLNEYWSSEAVPSEPFCHPIECDPKENPFNIQYVRAGAIPSGDSILMYDLGVTHVAVSGQQADGNVLGDLWVTYEVELKKPVVDSNATSTFRWGRVVTSGPPAAGNWFNGATLESGNTIISAVGNKLTLARGVIGTYMISVILNASPGWTAADLSGVATVTGCSIASIAPSYAYSRNIGSGQRLFYTNAVTITDQRVSATITFPTGILTGGTGTDALIVVSRIVSA